MSVWPIVSGFVGGVIAWLITTFLAQPFQKYLQLRQDAALALAEYEHSRRWTGDPDEEPPSKEWLEKRAIAYDKAGTALVAFALANSFVTRLLHSRVLASHRRYVRSAGELLRNLARLSPGTQSGESTHMAVLRNLGIAYIPSMRRPWWRQIWRSKERDA